MNFDEVFSFKHLYNSYLKCCKGVNWKTSTINFRMKAIQHIARLRNQLIKGTYKSRGFSIFTIRERGKEREIKAVHISERVVQKCLCDYFLVPLINKKLIYDSGATIKNKGFDFALKRLQNHLQKFGRKYKNNGFILTFDYSKYFDTINHEMLLNWLKVIIKEEKLYNITEYFIKCFGEKGLGLGSQISQILALYYVSKIDHYIKEILKCKYYGRYMDDCYIICEDKRKLQELKHKLVNLSKELKLTPNINKCKIQPLKNFSYLSRIWKLKETNFILTKPKHSNIIRFRRKFRYLYNNAKDKIYQFISSINGYIQSFKNIRLNNILKVGF